ncbi:MAG TPA: ABC transporter permease [Gemmatimonadales bacterium]|nr:ABC transporter permease [Gemmatimonadales bacterium]
MAESPITAKEVFARPPVAPRSGSLVQLTLTRLREVIREPEAVFWTFVFPLLLAAGLAVAFRARPPEVRVVGVLQDAADPEPAASAIAGLAGTEGLVPLPVDSASAATALATGKIDVLVIPGEYGVQYRYDPTRPEARIARLLADGALQRSAGRIDPLGVEDVRVAERGARYIDFFMPGLLGMNLMGSGIWAIGFSIVSARSKKLLKRLVATPMSRAQFLLSFLLSRLVFLVLEVVVLVGVAHYGFGVPLRGPLAVLALITLLGALAFCGLGVLIAARPQTTEGASGLMNLAMLPMWVFSGVFFASSRFPAAIQPFVQALPLTAVNDALRANMLEGAGLGAVAGELAILVAWAAGTFLLALRLFRWR